MAKFERTRMLIAGNLQGVPIMPQIEDFDPPAIEKEMQAARGGRFAPEQVMVGLKEMTATLTINGAGWMLIKPLGVNQGDSVMLDIRESGKTTDGSTFSTWHSIGGTLVSIKERKMKMGDLPQTEFVFAPYRYTRLEDGIQTININLRTQVIDLGAGDIMADIRRAVLLT